MKKHAYAFLVVIIKYKVNNIYFTFYFHYKNTGTYIMVCEGASEQFPDHNNSTTPTFPEILNSWIWHYIFFLNDMCKITN